MSNKQYLTDAATKHQVFLQRYAGTEYKQMAAFIAKVLKETEAMLARATTITSKARLDTIIKDLTAMSKAIYKDMAKGTKGRMVDLAKYESDFTSRLLEQAVDFPNADGQATPFAFNSPTVDQLRAAAFTSILDSNPAYKGTKGLTVGQALEQFGSNKSGDIVQAVRVGFALGKTNQEISQDIRKTMESVTTRQAQTLARTITNHVAAQSRNEFYSSNSDVLEDYYTVVATLDERTSLECAALDGKTFDVNDFEAPPYHWNCRTTYIREVKEKYKVDITGVSRTAKGDEGIEQVASNTTFGSWIKTQPESFQDEVLGSQRASLLRAGMSVDKFVDGNYQPLTLDALRNKDNEHIFTKAGL